MSSTATTAPGSGFGRFAIELRQHLSAAAEGKGRVVAIVGAGVSRGASGSELATWQGLLINGIQRCVDARYRDESWANFQRDNLTRGGVREWVTVATNVEEALRQDGEGGFKEWLDQTVGALRVRSGGSGVIEAIVKLRCPIVTTNYDNLIEDVTGRRYCTWEDFEQSRKVLDGTSSHILHIHGHYERPATVILDVESYAKHKYAAQFQRLEEAIRATTRMVFIGCGDTLGDPNFRALRAWARESLQGKGANFSYWFIPKAEEDLRRRRLEKGDQIHLIPYPDHDSLLPLLQFIAPSVPAAP